MLPPLHLMSVSDADVVYPPLLLKGSILPRWSKVSETAPGSENQHPPSPSSGEGDGHWQAPATDLLLPPAMFQERIPEDSLAVAIVPVPLQNSGFHVQRGGKLLLLRFKGGRAQSSGDKQPYQAELPLLK